jgi:hypothetical protein
MPKAVQLLLPVIRKRIFTLPLVANRPFSIGGNLAIFSNLSAHKKKQIALFKNPFFDFVKSRTVSILSFSFKANPAFIFFAKRTLLSKAKNLLIAAVAQSSKVIIADQQFLTLYGITGQTSEDVRVEPTQRIAHGFRGILGLVGGMNFVLCYDKKEYATFDLELKNQTSKQPLSKPVKFVIPIEENRSATAQGLNFLIVYQDIQLGFIPPPGGSPPNVQLPREVLSVAVRIPFIYTVTERSLQIFETIGQINECLDVQPHSYGVLLMNESQIIAVRFQSPQPQIDRLARQSQWDSALELCRALSGTDKSRGIDTTQFVNRLHKEHSDELLQKPDFDGAFAEFKLSRQEPFVMLRLFRRFVPPALRDLAKIDCERFLNLARELRTLYERNAAIDELCAAIDRLKQQTGDRTKTQAKDVLGKFEFDKADNLSQIAEAEKLLSRLDRELCADSGPYDRTDEAAVLALHTYVEELLASERQPTLRKIYQTISFECIATIRPLALPETIAKNPPLFFDVAAEALKAQTNEFLQFCELHHKHKRVIEYIWPDQKKSPPESVLDL